MTQLEKMHTSSGDSPKILGWTSRHPSTLSAQMVCPPPRRPSSGIILMMGLLVMGGLALGTIVKAQESTSGRSSSDQATTGEGIRWGGLVTTGSFTIGVRHLFLAGSHDVYRSQVNLGNGLRLLGVAVESRAPENGGSLLDFLSYEMGRWGDPFNTARLRVEKRGIYRFNATYSRIEYVHFLPTFANPLLGRGVFFGQHSFHASRRQSGYTLTLFPQRDISFYFGYDRNTQFGMAFTTFSIGLDEFLLLDPLRTTTDDYRIGADLRVKRVFLTIEQGFRAFKNDIHTNQPPGPPNVGNNVGLANPTSQNPQQILLTGFRRDSAVRGFVPTTRVALHSHLFKPLFVTGRFAYSDATIDFNRSEAVGGTLFDRTVLRYFTGQTSTSTSDASRPNAVADGSVNFRPHRRWTFTTTSRFNHFDIAGGVLTQSTQTLGSDLRGNPPPANEPPRLVSEALDARTHVTSFFNQFEGIVEVTSRLTLRAGHRLTHRRVELDRPQLTEPERSTLNTNAFVGGVSLRASTALRVFSQIERGTSDNVFTRVAAYRFTRLRIRSEYRPTSTVTVNGQVLVTDSRNPNPLVDNIRRHRGMNLTTAWFPGERLSLTVSYSRSDISSFVDIINPRFLTVERSVYIANDNYLDGDIDLTPVKNLHLSVGYSVVNSQGTFPLNFHQPRALVSYSFPRRMVWAVGWRWYGYNEKGLSLQDYRAHTLTASMKLSF